MIPKIKSVKPLSGYLLYVVFDDGKDCIYDVTDDINSIKAFADLKYIHGFFEQVQLDKSRTCVFWNDSIDLPSDALYEYGKPVILWDPDFTKVTPAECAALKEVTRKKEKAE